MGEIRINNITYGGSSNANEIAFDKADTNMVSINVQDAILEIWSELQLRALRDYEVIYMVDTGVGYRENVQLGLTALLPTSFVPTKSGYEFVGWRKDNAASNNILTECTVENDSLILWRYSERRLL